MSQHRWALAGGVRGYSCVSWSEAPSWSDHPSSNISWSEQGGASIRSSSVDTSMHTLLGDALVRHHHSPVANVRRQDCTASGRGSRPTFRGHRQQHSSERHVVHIAPSSRVGAADGPYKHVPLRHEADSTWRGQQAPLQWPACYTQREEQTQSWLMQHSGCALADSSSDGHGALPPPVRLHYAGDARQHMALLGASSKAPPAPAADASDAAKPAPLMSQPEASLSETAGGLVSDTEWPFAAAEGSEEEHEVNPEDLVPEDLLLDTIVRTRCVKPVLLHHVGCGDPGPWGVSRAKACLQ